MDCSYGIGVTNRFALFLDSDGDPDALNDLEDQKKDQDKPSKKQEKKARADAKSKQNQQLANSKKEPLQQSNTRKEESMRESSSKPPRQQQQQQQQQQQREGSGGDYRRPGNRTTFYNNSTDIENKRPDYRRNNRERRPPVQRDDAEGAQTNPQTPQQVDFRNERDSRERSERGRGGFRGRGARGRGGYFGGRDNRGKREFERHSGSDKSSSVKAQDKRDGAGSHNWGNVRDDVKEATTNPEMNTSAVSDDPDWTPKTGDEPMEPKDGLTEEETAAQEPEVQQMTLDEYKEQQLAEREKLANKFNFRKAGEGEDQGQWKKTYKLKHKPGDSKYKKAEDNFVRGERCTKTPAVEIEIKFSDTNRGGGRGGGGSGGPGRRGGGRGSGGRGRRGSGGMGRGSNMGRGGGNNNMKSHFGVAAPRIEDENDFPSLGK